MPADLLTTKQVAARLGKDVRTIHRWADTGKLPHAVKIEGVRGAYLFHVTEVERLEDEGAGSAA